MQAEVPNPFLKKYLNLSHDPVLFVIQYLYLYSCNYIDILIKKIWLNNEELILFQEYIVSVFLCVAGYVFVYIGKTTNMKKLSAGEAKSPNAIGLAAQHFYIIHLHPTAYNRTVYRILYSQNIPLLYICAVLFRLKRE